MSLKTGNSAGTLRNAIWDSLLILGLVAWGVAGRFWIETPNFKTVGAACLLAGLLLKNLRVACLVPITTLFITDLFLGGYELGVALFVYASTAAYLLIGHFGSKFLLRCASGSPENLVPFAMGAVFISLFGSLQFFLLTNFAVWAFSGWYGLGWGELGRCFIAAIPFFKWTLFSDLCFFALPVVVSMTIASSWAGALDSPAMDLNRREKVR